MVKSTSKEIVKESSFSLIQEVISKLIPFGSEINSVLFDTPGRIQQKRINEFVKHLRSLVLELQLNTIDKEYFKSEDFYDLTRTIFECVIKTKSKEKHNALAKVYLNGIIEKSDLEKDLTTIFSKFIIDLMPQQILVLFFIEKHEEELVEIASYENFYKLFVSKYSHLLIGKYELKYFCSDLENKALVSFGAGLSDFNATNSLMAFEDHRDSSAKLSELGIKFIEFLKE